MSDQSSLDPIRYARRMGARLERYATDESISASQRGGGCLDYRFAYDSDLGQAGGFQTEVDAARAYLRVLAIEIGDPAPRPIAIGCP